MVEDWFTITELNSNTFAISELKHWEKVHSFLLVGTERAVLIDSGLGIYSIKKIVEKLTDLPISVITTHVHSDHIGNHGEFDSIAVHKNEADWLRNGIPGLPIEAIRENLVRGVSEFLPEEFDLNEFTLYQGEPQSVLTDGTKIDLGDRSIEVTFTPGHSPGHICLFDTKQGFLFTGDLLYLDTPIYAFYPTTSPTDLIDSLKRILDIRGIQMIYGSHNTLGISPSILSEVSTAITYLEEHNLVKFGTGIHRFQNISFQF